MNMDKKIAVFAAATKNELYDTDICEEGTPYGWQVYAVETQETLDQYIEASECCWIESTRAMPGVIAGFPFVAWHRIQVKKGQPRDSMSVVDFGNVRMVLRGTDLTNFV